MPATDALNQVERAQGLIEKGPVTFVAAFFALSFVVALWMLVRAKDRHLQEITAIHKEQQERAVKLEVTLHGLREMMEPLRIIALESQGKIQRRRKADATGQAGRVAETERSQE